MGRRSGFLVFRRWGLLHCASIWHGFAKPKDIWCLQGCTRENLAFGEKVLEQGHLDRLSRYALYMFVFIECYGCFVEWQQPWCLVGSIQPCDVCYHVVHCCWFGYVDAEIVVIRRLCIIFCEFCESQLFDHEVRECYVPCPVCCAFGAGWRLRVVCVCWSWGP